MKKWILFLIVVSVWGCKDEEQTTLLPAETRMNVSYGADAGQKIDIYLPAGRTTNTKVIVLVHGGGWSGGSRANFNYFIPVLKNEFPDHAIQHGLPACNRD